MNQNLIFDIGFHKGEDTISYLNKGYNVIAIEANPLLVEIGKQKFSKYIKTGQLILINNGISKERAVLDFWINEYNSEWSSFNKSIGCRPGTTCHKIEVSCVTTADLISNYGLPYYIKIDIEGYDIYAIETIKKELKPKYISCEAQQIEWLDTLNDLGYTKFKIINQADRFNDLNINKEKSKIQYWKKFIINGVMNRTSNFINWKYPIKSSGPFGDESKGIWKTIDEVKELYKKHYQYEKNTPLNNISWFDFHATY